MLEKQQSNGKIKQMNVEQLLKCYDSFMTSMSQLRINKAFNEIELPSSASVDFDQTQNILINNIQANTPKMHKSVLNLQQ